MKRKIKHLVLIVLWAIALVLSAHARAVDESPAMLEWKAAASLMGDLRTPLDPSQLARGAAAIERAKAIGGTTERECELIDAVSEFYFRAAERPHDERLVRYERALSRSQRLLPDDLDIAALHAQASKAALARARERVAAAYARQQPGDLPIEAASVELSFRGDSPGQ